MPAAYALRHDVFVIGQDVPADLELDELDATAVHVVALIGDRSSGQGGSSTAESTTTCSSSPALPGTVGTIGRMAVAPRRAGPASAARCSMLSSTARVNSACRPSSCMRSCTRATSTSGPASCPSARSTSRPGSSTSACEGALTVVAPIVDAELAVRPPGGRACRRPLVRRRPVGPGGVRARLTSPAPCSSTSIATWPHRRHRAGSAPAARIRRSSPPGMRRRASVTTTWSLRTTTTAARSAPAWSGCSGSPVIRRRCSTAASPPGAGRGSTARLRGLLRSSRRSSGRRTCSCRWTTSTGSRCSMPDRPTATAARTRCSTAGRGTSPARAACRPARARMTAAYCSRSRQLRDPAHRGRRRAGLGVLVRLGRDRLPHAAGRRAPRPAARAALRRLLVPVGRDRPSSRSRS